MIAALLPASAFAADDQTVTQLAETAHYRRVPQIGAVEARSKHTAGEMRHLEVDVRFRSNGKPVTQAQVAITLTGPDNEPPMFRSLAYTAC